MGAGKAGKDFTVGLKGTLIFNLGTLFRGLRNYSPLDQKGRKGLIFKELGPQGVLQRGY